MNVGTGPQGKCSGQENKTETGPLHKQALLDVC